MPSGPDGISVSSRSSPAQSIIGIEHLSSQFSQRNGDVWVGHDVVTAAGAVKYAMASLPVPNNEYQIVLPTSKPEQNNADHLHDFDRMNANLNSSSSPIERDALEIEAKMFGATLFVLYRLENRHFEMQRRTNHQQRAGTNA